MIVTSKYVNIDYTNWRSVRAVRTILPEHAFFGVSEYHKNADGQPEPQWFWQARDEATGQLRMFAIKNIHSWEPTE